MTEQTNTQPELTDEQALAKLEERVAAMEPGPFRREWEGIVAIERNRQRCRAIEEATRVKLPPDTNRWRISVSPPPASPPAEPSPQRPGFVDDVALAPPPGIRWVDALCDAAAARDRAEAIAAERMRRQAVLDAHAEAKLIDEQLRRAEAERMSFHRAPGDADWPSS